MRPLGVELAAMLANRGLSHVFGIPGVHNLELYRGLEQSGLTHVLARNEMGAGFMADGYARATGRPGVVFTITGPGFTNAMTPIGQAYSDSVPMLVIATCLDETAARRGQLHQMRDQEGAGRAVAEWSETARTPEAAYALIDRALTEMALARPRPRIVHLPVPLLSQPARPAPERCLAVEDRRLHLPPVVIEWLTGAERPLFILGGGAQHCGYDVRDVVRRLGAATFETYAGRGIVGPYALNFSSALARPSSEEVIAAADVVVTIGTELAETDLWRDRLGATGRVIHVDIEPAGGNSRAAVHVVADAKEFLGALLARLDGHEARSLWTAKEVRAARRRWRKEVETEHPGIVPVVDALRKSLPDLTAIYSDMTQFAYAAKEVWAMSRPGFWHHPYGFGTLGYALPAAIGGAIARPPKFNGPTLVIVGDSGLQYTIQELGTAAELGLSLPILLWDNEALGQIRDGMIAAGISPNAVHQVNPDWRHLAAAYRCGYERPRTIADLVASILDAFGAGRPTLIHARPDLSP